MHIWYLASLSSSVSDCLTIRSRSLLLLNLSCRAYSHSSLLAMLQHVHVYIIQDILVLFIRLSLRSYTRLAATFSFTIRLRDARTYDCYRIFSFIIVVYVTLVHMVFQPVWGSLRLAPINERVMIN